MFNVFPQADEFSRLLWASIRSPETGRQGSSLIIGKHFTHTLNLVLGQQLDFYPSSDPWLDRLSTLNSILDATSLKSFLPDILKKLMGTGEILIWLRSTPSGYRIRYYHFSQFVPHFKPDSDDLESVTIRYKSMADKRQVLHEIFIDSTGSIIKLDGGDPITTANPFPFLPIYLIRNKAVGPGERSASDFTGLEDEIVRHHAISKIVASSVRKYARNSLMTNLPRSQILKSNESGRIRSVVEEEGYRLPRLTDSEPTEEVAEFIGVDGPAGESFIQTIEWNPISSDQMSYLDNWEKKIFRALGSLDEVGGNTAYESRLILAFPLATANQKAYYLFDMGLIPMLSDLMQYSTQAGLIMPVSDSRLKWRRVELVEPSVQDQLNLSILTRNLSEQGVGDAELLKMQFPGKTEDEIERITGGAGGTPYRKIDKTVEAVEKLIALQSQTTDPFIMNQLYNVISDLMLTMQRSLDYGRGRQYQQYSSNSGYSSGSEPIDTRKSTSGRLEELGGNNPVDSQQPKTPLRKFLDGINTFRSTIFGGSASGSSVTGNPDPRDT